MNIQRLTYSEFHLPFVRPLATSKGQMTERSGFLLAVQDDQGRIGVGEASPLPDYGTETLDDTRQQLEHLAAHPPQTIDDIPAQFPALIFGLESALMALEDPAPESRRVRANALINGANSEDLLEAASHAIAEGYRTLKIKVGLQPWHRDVECIEELRDAFPAVRLRVDANRAWSLVEACEFGQAVEELHIEYFEDPLKNPTAKELKALAECCPVSIALDESARTARDVEYILEFDLCDVLVLKPSAIGSRRKLADFSAQAQAAGMDVVISSLLESSVGLSYLVACALDYGSPTRDHGLGTAGLLARDTLRTSLLPLKGEVTLPDLRHLPELLTPELSRALLC